MRIKWLEDHLGQTDHAFTINQTLWCKSRAQVNFLIIDIAEVLRTKTSPINAMKNNKGRQPAYPLNSGNSLIYALRLLNKVRLPNDPDHTSNFRRNRSYRKNLQTDIGNLWLIILKHKLQHHGIHSKVLSSIAASEQKRRKTPLWYEL